MSSRDLGALTLTRGSISTDLCSRHVGSVLSALQGLGNEDTYSTSYHLLKHGSSRFGAWGGVSSRALRIKRPGAGAAPGPQRTTRPQPLGQALVLQFTLAQALVVPWWDLALAQGSPKAWHALVVPWLTEIHQG